jgi:hypothetical protein
MSSNRIDPMLRDVLSGALRLWDVVGTVERDADALIVAVGGTTLRIVPRAPHGWLVIRGTETLGEHAGVAGLLRQLREELAPQAARGRLIIGAQ